MYIYVCICIYILHIYMYMYVRMYEAYYSHTRYTIFVARSALNAYWIQYGKEHPA